MAMSAVAAVFPMCQDCHPDWGKLTGHKGVCVRLSAEEKKQRDNKVCVCTSFFGALFFGNVCLYFFHDVLERLLLCALFMRV